MKLQAIKKACNDRGNYLVLVANDGRQWLSNGPAAWPVDGITLTEEAIPAVFDIPPKKQKEVQIAVREYSDERFCIEPMNDYELPLQEAGRVLIGGTVYMALKNDRGLMLIDTDWLKPITSKDGRYTFFERWKMDRQPLVAVYTDFFVGGLIAPFVGEDAAKKLEELKEIVYTPVYGHKEETK